MDFRSNLYEKYDSEDVSKLLYKRRVERRIKIISSFINQSKISRQTNITLVQDKYIIKNAVNYKYFLAFAHVLLNALLYKVLFTGVYNIRDFYWNPGTVHSVFKLAFSSAISYYFFSRSWKSYIYSPEFYRLATESLNQESKTQ